ncbi:TetR/AcrR family transcriptional regulator [Phytohabitans aurantiacus]|jgi:AcrR family transcriptional regulator|uniref:TetR family transcriptional regulator n=1 Tax=Phytohabitans aurantiacus TaxID=3016789 RepID=A0ABQ5R4P9_9ACTN|nr:TetR/AcrR family transcriptional regulator C-terminal domain-containing protein [Phytohabitans aurantiacus]GLI01764.1 TetR family transcriptional regulator [Phytohabitans aurantiacus]
MAVEPNRDVEAHVRRLWRHRGTTVPTPRRGPRQQLDLDEILRAGIAIADAEGLAAVSTRAIAAEFDKSGMVIYPYVGTKENLLALMQDHASAMPSWDDPVTSLADALHAWAEALFDVYLSHPWLTERPWSQATQGPNEQDWLERLLRVLDTWAVAPGARAPAVTMLYATVRATAGTAAAYERMNQQGMAEWRERAEATMALIPDFGQRYPMTTGLEPVTARWQDAPRAGLACAVRLLAAALVTP